MDIFRYLRTIRYLKIIQIIYQIRYRIMGYRYPHIKDIPLHLGNFDISVPALDCDDQYIGRFQPNGILNNQIELLNESVTWSPGKWEVKEKSHLWNFNLHYFEYFIALASKYKSTKEEQYRCKIIELYQNWHDTCFLQHMGDAWHPYTVSLRLKNLLIVYGILGDDYEESVINDIYEQYRFLLKNQEKHLLGNHYFENLTTIYLCSVFFQEEQVKKRTEVKIAKQIKEQVLSDGMHFERSFMYHNLILEDLIRIWLVSENSFQKYLESVIKRMADCAFSFEEEGRLPLFNDAGSNVAKRKSQLLEAVKEIFDYEAEEQDLPYAGYYKLKNDLFSIFIDVGQFAPTYISGHGHCDALSLEMFYKGEPILVNSGTYQYQSELREYFRGTTAHNTIRAYGTEQSECWGEHRTARRSSVINALKTHNCVKGTIKDYRGNIMSRSVVLKEKIVIRDECSIEHENYWHIHPSNLVKRISDSELEIMTKSGDAIRMKADSELKPMDSWYAEEFGKIERNKAFASNSRRIDIFA